MELVAYLHGEMLCERLEQGESIDRNVDCQLLNSIAQSSQQAKSLLCVGLAASAIAMNMPSGAFAYQPEVANIQQLLAKRGFNPGAIDGVKGPTTTEAIVAAQIFYKLNADGVAGAQTLAALQADTYEANAANTVPTTPISDVKPAVDSPNKSDAIKNLQQLLSDRGFYGGAIDGIKGPMTQEAVILAQKTYGLIPDGVAGSLTLAALEAGSNVVPISYKDPASQPTASNSDDVIKKGQVLLSNLGLYDGAIDGIQGAQTTAAIKKAQALYGLPVDGVLGAQTLAALQS
ncbi:MULTISPECIES: peptidoglycan-binding domain-containing protein [Pseudanabaena]|uniref:Peptidoglycan-binding domain 1 protein n=2 Tax=Pseudanabaena TaxID=1152 RepID=L8N4B8_9CYAN|nr:MULTISPECIES: peptidoglycan-binding protein [Pseudanabaena]ELS34516.1 Peptidoglycan-binding domain 1 protein [Pseudanabaena biceps PCC 7429]MDG3493287.1 peptidoglycan-binding protein [Pseudanabaena catenata USMAC16]